MLKIGHLAKSIGFAWAIASAKYSIWAKNLNSLKYVKIDSASLLEIFCAKNHSKNTEYSRNETILKIRNLAKSIAFAWAIPFAKYSIWPKILNCLKHVKIDSVFALEQFPAKNCSKKHQIFKK